MESVLRRPQRWLAYIPTVESHHATKEWVWSKKRDHVRREKTPDADFHEEAQEWKGVLTAPLQAAVAAA
jgi:hypothetical protein